MPKVKKSLRGFRCADSFQEIFKDAADKADMSSNEYVMTALRQALKTGVQGEGGLDFEVAGKLELADSLSKAISSTEQIVSAMKKRRKVLGGSSS